jgi:hypothetical protein
MMYCAENTRNLPFRILRSLIRNLNIGIFLNVLELTSQQIQNEIVSEISKTTKYYQCVWIAHHARLIVNKCARL